MNLAEAMRPKTLNEVIGNDHIVSALNNQFNKDNLSQTILFTGDAGTGKTTFAKIIASHLEADVTEIDCGSEGSIETIRDIVDSVRLNSLFADHKVFILDEVHALSKPGQSALLKTIEDPQENVYFILLTTEPNKILNTIKTRCVEYKTLEATTEEIGQAVKRVEEKFSITFEDRKDLWSLVEQSKGSLRQVYAHLEKLVAVADEKNVITSSMFHKTLGAPMDHVDENLPKAFLNKDIPTVMSIVSSLKKSGNNPVGTLLGVYNYLRVVYTKSSNLEKESKLMMSDIADRVSSREATWESIESLAWKHL